jgi:hypothetical protein
MDFKRHFQSDRLSVSLDGELNLVLGFNDVESSRRTFVPSTARGAAEAAR